MSIGPAVRTLMPAQVERVVSNAYRRMFVDLDVVAAEIASLGSFTTMIEVGCGEGALVSRLVDLLPDGASASGIDICEEPGAKYDGASTNVTFRRAEVGEIAAEGSTFELVVVSDVLHHVPLDQREDFLRSCRAIVAPGGTIVLKEWVRRRNLAHAAAFASDRYVTGDRNVRFYDADELRALFTRSFAGPGTRVVERVTRPHRNNVLLATTV